MFSLFSSQQSAKAFHADLKAPLKRLFRRFFLPLEEDNTEATRLGFFTMPASGMLFDAT